MEHNLNSLAINCTIDGFNTLSGFTTTIFVSYDQ